MCASSPLLIQAFRYNLARYVLKYITSPYTFILTSLLRDWLVGNATAQSSIIDTSAISNTSTFSGSTQYGGYTYQTSVQYVSGLLPNTSVGINHNLTVSVNGVPACDGLVALLDVKITTKPAGSSS